MIENNLSLFDAHFQDLYIDKYQFLQIMLIMFQQGNFSDIYV
ncbi:hypothetical protein SF301_2862 [Shigella flexneri 2a str. 301]|uniref:Uncharacterized protein n=1 Tax=Shigella flexneri 2a str. 301 TaxID=198214 RepID=A0AB36P9W6_SHIFL|nr:hypothetical protein SF301_2862 [Shigella flexneri 2a str. 301]